jgi:hypothetical protein
MPAMNSSQNTHNSPYRGHDQHSSDGDDSESVDPAGSQFYKRNISALEDTLNRREEEMRVKKRSVSTFLEN